MASAGQDVWIAAQFPKGYQGWGFDVGATDGHLISNTLALEQAGWNILCVEAMHIYAPALTRNRKRYLMCAVDGHAREWGTFHLNVENPTSYSALRPGPYIEPGHLLELRVPVLTLNQLLYMSGFPRLDLVSIDIEGTELDALKGLDIARWCPRVIVAECWPGTDAAMQMQDYLGPFGYRDVATMEHDHGFVYVGDYRRAGRQVDRDGTKAVARPGGSVPVPADGPRRVRRRKPRGHKANLGSASTTKP